MPFKDDIRNLAELKQKLSQKIILLAQHIAKMSLCWEISCETWIRLIIYPIAIA